MFASKPRGSRIVYVASSARELPEEVQQWLGHSEHRASSSPNIYDALARMASGARPAILIVNVDAVDWNEMEFFDSAARISRTTSIYAVGQDHNAAKIDAACKRGAHRFNPEAMEEDLSAPPAWSRNVGVKDILAASLRPSHAPKVPLPNPMMKPVPEESREAEEADEPTKTTPADRSVAPSPVRLVTPAAELETEVESGTEPEPGEANIPFPWSPSPNRPQRVPPKAPMAEIKTPSAAAMAASPIPAATPQRQPVELTADELAALMGRPVPSDTSAKEGLG